PEPPAGDPSALLPGEKEFHDELVAIEGGYGSLYDRYAGSIAGAATLPELEERKAESIGRERGEVTRALGEVAALPLEQKKVAGRALNLIKRRLEELEKAKRAALEAAALPKDALDVTLPGRRPWVGRPHVLAQVRDELLDLFHGIGYSVYESREVERDEYNFTKLNFPPDHPARDAHDTYFVSPDV